MASYPPPFTPDPREQIRQAAQQAKAAARYQREQIKAQRDVLRAQRDLYRYQNRPYRRGSILGPVIVLAVGIFALLVSIGRIPVSAFWTWYGRFWPFLLVLAGVILLAEWAFDQVPRADGTPAPARGIGGGAIALLLILAFTGAGVQVLHLGRNVVVNNFGFTSDAFDQLIGEKHESTQTAEADFPAGTSLAVDNPHGDVTITGTSDDNKVHITLSKQIYSQSDSDADSKAQKLSPQITRTGSTLSVSLPSLDGAMADLAITVPDFGDTTVTVNHGDIAVSNLKAPVTLTANHGDIELNAITGAVNAHMNHSGSSFQAHTIAGDLAIHGHADDVTATDITGRTTIEGEFYGDTHLEHLHGASSFHTSRTQLTFERLDGELDISPHSDLTASDLAGPTTLRTRSRNITFTRIAGPVDIVNSEGSVDLVAVQPIGNITVTDKNGEVNLTMPEKASFAIDAQTNGGEIDSAFGLHPDNSEKRAALQGQVGKNGPSISIRTTHLNIGLHSGGETAEPPSPPPAPSRPTPPTPPTPPTLKGTLKPATF